MLNVAILGANGFIGSRAVEMLHLGGLAEVRPIVRSLSRLARLSRFNLDCRVADAFDPFALRAAFEGCDVVVHAIAGDRKTIVESLAPTYQAAQAAGVRRLVYLSTASVHGQSPSPGTDETSPLDNQQPIEYNNSKVEAERQLRELRQTGSVEIVILRPGIVFGPRSFWISRFAADLLADNAYLVEGGRGICNSIYVDNLVHAIYLAMTTPDVDGEAFIVGDRETITWADFYQPVATALGRDLTQVHHVTYHPPVPTRKDQVKAILSTPPCQAIWLLVPPKLRKTLVMSFYRLWLSPPPRPSPWEFPLPGQPTALPTATLEMALLHQCQYKLPDHKARKMLGYEPIVPFSEACHRSIAWLAFAGYPVIEPLPCSHSQSSIPIPQPV